MCKRNIVLASLLIVLSLFISIGVPEYAQSQKKYPSSSIDIIVPYHPGGSTDLSNRFIAEYLKETRGIIVNIINKPGGGGVPANLLVYKARPDGYTLFGDNSSCNVTLDIAVKDLPFKVMDRTFIAMHSASPHVICVSASSPYKTLQDLLNDLKRDPDNFTYVSSGALASLDVIYRQAAKAIGVDPLRGKPIVTGGASKAASVAAAGAVKMGGGSVSSQIVTIKAGAIRPLAICSKTRWPELPNVPTTAELGYPSIDFLQWNGLSGPPNLPTSIVKAWEEYIQAMVKDPVTVAKLEKTGSLAIYMSSEELRKHVQKTFIEMKSLWGMK